MQKIQQLSQQTISQIAAGEVIERPASIVKELLENSIDAGATQIHIHLKAGGKTQLRIDDNGHGINKADLPLVPVRYATSKIRTLDDLFNTRSFGFRGEAISSVCQVADVQILSREQGADLAYGITSQFGEIGEVTQGNREPGTSIDVRDLFATLPVRAKFLKSNQTEATHCYDVVLHYALSHPELDMVLVNDDKTLLNSTGISDLAALSHSFLNKALGKQGVAFESHVGDVAVSGYLSLPTLTHGNRSKQFFAMNGRLVKSALLNKAFTQAYKDLIPHNRFPMGILNIETDPSLLDVNIHPQKTEVKFLNPGFLFDAITKGVKTALHGHQKPRLELSPVETTFTDSPTASTAPPSSNWEFPLETTLTTPSRAPAPTLPYGQTQQAQPQSTLVKQQLQAPLIQQEDVDRLRLSDMTHFQIFDTYIVLKALDHLWILDQHAVHERILYEQIKDDFETKLDSQPLLVPDVLDLTPKQYLTYEAHTDTLASLGFVVEPFGQNQLVVREIPAKLANAKPGDLFIQFIDELSDTQASPDLTLSQKETLQMKACKAAIKAGKRMPDLEVERLLKELALCPSNYTCPHGRPLFVSFSKLDLEKLFLRT